MKTFKTPKGTELPLADIKGKDYLLVPHRVVWFREEYPFGRIQTMMAEASDKHAMYRATIAVPWDNDYRILATATKREDASHFPDFHEKAETGAIGRALALCGYGTQFAHELEEGDRIVDAPLRAATNTIHVRLEDSSHTTKTIPVGFSIPAPHQPMPTPPSKHAEPLIVRRANQVFQMGKFTGQTFRDVALNKREEASNYAKWAKGTIAEQGIKAHGDLKDFVEYIELMTKEK